MSGTPTALRTRRLRCFGLWFLLTTFALSRLFHDRLESHTRGWLDSTDSGFNINEQLVEAGGKLVMKSQRSTFYDENPLPAKVRLEVCPA